MSRVAYWGDIGTSEHEAIDRLVSNPPRLVAVDIETVSLVDKRIIGVGVATGEDEAYYFPLLTSDGSFTPWFNELLNVLSNPEITKVYHNAIFDLVQLVNYGVDMTNIIDTKVMAALLGLPGDLKTLYSVLQGSASQGRSVMGRFELEEVKNLIPRGGDMLSVPYEQVARKCLGDTLATYRCYEAILPHVGHEYLKQEMLLVPMLVKISRRGIKLDPEQVKGLDIKHRQEVNRLKSQAESQGFNPASPEQVGFMLMAGGQHMPVKRVMDRRTRQSKYKVRTGEEILRGLVDIDPVAKLTLEYRKVSKLHSTYVKPYLGKSRAYTTLYFGAVTGRLASRERNLQNIPPGEVRNMFLPDTGMFTDFDFSQQELRILAHLSRDEAMLRVYEEGLDIHQYTADFMCIGRRVAKNVTFAMIYGGDPQTIMETAGLSDINLAKELRSRWFAKYPQAGKWIESTAEQGLLDRKVQTIGGRILYLPEQWEKDDAGVMRDSVNYTIQGSAAELTKKAMLLCKHLDVVLQIHDELLIEGNIEEEDLKSLGLEDVGPFKCPITVKHLERWE